MQLACSWKKKANRNLKPVGVSAGELGGLGKEGQSKGWFLANLLHNWPISVYSDDKSSAGMLLEFFPLHTWTLKACILWTYFWVGFPRNPVGSIHSYNNNTLWQCSCLLCPFSFNLGFLLYLNIVADSWTCLLFVFLLSSMWVIPVYMRQVRHVQVLAGSRPWIRQCLQ